MFRRKICRTTSWQRFLAVAAPYTVVYRYGHMAFKSILKTMVLKRRKNRVFCTLGVSVYHLWRCPFQRSPQSVVSFERKPLFQMTKHCQTDPTFLKHLVTSISKYQIFSWMKPNLFVWKTKWNFRETFECSLDCIFLRWCVLFKRNFPHLEGDDRAKKMCLHWGKKREVPCKKRQKCFFIYPRALECSGGMGFSFSASSNSARE